MPRKRAAWLALAACMAAARAAHAAPVRMAVADFDYEDSSGEARDQRAAHAARLLAFKTVLIAVLAKGGRFAAVALECAAPPCSAARLDQAGMVTAAHAQDARYVVFGGVHKVSTLIEFGEVDVMALPGGNTALARTITFRGDSDEAWARAADFVAQMIQADGR